MSVLATMVMLGALIVRGGEGPPRELKAEVRASIEAEPNAMERSHVRRWAASLAILRGDLGTAAEGIDLARIGQGGPLRDR